MGKPLSSSSCLASVWAEMSWEGWMARCWTWPGDPITITIIITTLTIVRRHSSQSPRHIRDPRDTSRRSCDIAVRKFGLWCRATRKVWFNKAAQRKTLHWLLSIFVCLERFPWPLLVLYSISIMTTWIISQPSPTFVVISHLRPHAPCHSFYDHQTEYLSISLNGVYDEVRVWSGDNPGYHWHYPPDTPRSSS